MRNTITRLGVCTLMLTALAVQAGSEEPVYLKFDAGVSIVNDVDVKSIRGVDVNGKLELDPGFRADVVGGYNLTEDWAIELEAGLVYNTVKDVDVDVYQVPMMVNMVYTMPLDSRFKPYIGGGAGGILELVSGDDVDENDLVFGFQAMAGVDYEINERADIGLGYKFLGAIEPEFGGVEFENVYSHAIIAAFKFRF